MNHKSAWIPITSYSIVALYKNAINQSINLQKFSNPNINSQSPDVQRNNDDCLTSGMKEHQSYLTTEFHILIKVW